MRGNRDVWLPPKKTYTWAQCHQAIKRINKDNYNIVKSKLADILSRQKSYIYGSSESLRENNTNKTFMLNDNEVMDDFSGAYLIYAMFSEVNFECIYISTIYKTEETEANYSCT